MWSAHEVDGRIAAKNAVKIRAALRNSIDARRVFENYLTTQPAVSVNEGQDRARARAWALLNLRINNEALKQALLRLYAEAWVTGDLVAEQEIQIAQSEQSKSADITKAEDDVMIIDWDTWQPGDAASAMLLDPPQAFQNLVSRSGNLITGLDKTGYELIGTALADSIRLGLSPSRAAKRINETIGSPARALSIAVTESSRVMNASAMNRYKESGIKQHKWMPVLAVAGGGVACERCAQNTGQVVNIGASFNSGNTQPPAHPHCRCNLQPVLPDYSELFDKDGNYVAPPVNQNGVTDIAPNVSDFQIRRGFTLTETQETIIEGYQNMDFTPMNDLLRIPNATLEKYNELHYDKLNPVTWKKINNKIKELKNIIESAPALEQTTTVYRGIKGDAAKKLRKLGAGSTYKEPGFVSTSFSDEVARRFQGDEGIFLEITVPTGTKGLSVEPVRSRLNSLGSPEYEWLMSPNTKFKVISKTDGIIRVEVLP
jgi:SPP1 gp7 family putative phage head morphogenesis protein